MGGKGDTPHGLISSPSAYDRENRSIFRPILEYWLVDSWKRRCKPSSRCAKVGDASGPSIVGRTSVTSHVRTLILFLYCTKLTNLSLSMQIK